MTVLDSQTGSLMTMVDFNPKPAGKKYQARTLSNNPISELIRTQIISDVTHAATNAPRNLQKAIGPSEIGHPCPRNLAYKLSGIAQRPDYNDPFPSIVGTAMHTWMEDHLPDEHWLKEARVWPSDTISGSSDAYHKPSFSVVDWKFLGATGYRDYVGGYVSRQYRVQAHLYGRGYRRMGLRVDHVSLAVFCRVKGLNDLYVWSEPYNEELALAALRRLDDVRTVVSALRICDDNRAPIHQVPSDPGGGCYFCPFKGSTTEGYCEQLR